MSTRAKLTEASVATIKKDIKEGRAIAALARENKVDRRTIYNIKEGKTWTHV